MPVAGAANVGTITIRGDSTGCYTSVLMEGSVLSVSSRALVDACGRLGLDTAQILAAAKLDAATLRDPDARIPIEQAEALWRKAYEISTDPNLALHAIEVLPFGAYRVIDFLASSAPTIGAALAKVSDYFPLINDLVRLPYVVRGDEVPFFVEAPTRPASSPAVRSRLHGGTPSISTPRRLATHRPTRACRIAGVCSSCRPKLRAASCRHMPSASARGSDMSGSAEDADVA